MTVLQSSRLYPTGRILGGSGFEIRRVTADSRDVRNGDVFFAIRGTVTDGHDCIHDAIQAGCAGIVAEREVRASIPVCVVDCSRTAFARACMALAFPNGCPPVSCGITGTNGKTTTTWMLRSIIEQSGVQCGLLGTIQNHNGLKSVPATMTTLPADQLATAFQTMAAAGTTHCVLEVSSHALDQRRAAAVPLSAAGLTNITQDHLDYHQTRDAYIESKLQIADLLEPGAPLILNTTNDVCAQMNDRLSCSTPVITCAVGGRPADNTAAVVRQNHRSQNVRITLSHTELDVRLKLIGRHNAENALLAAVMADALRIAPEHIVSGLEQLESVPGRLQRLRTDQPYQVFVDYAHTPDAISHAVSTVRECVPGRVICMFGAGGNRDVSKRPLMGQAAALADVCVVTSDNPRSESPQEIIDQIISGMPATCSPLVEPDRRTAIQLAIQQAQPGDAVLICGKGHESVQIVGTQRHEFNDCLTAEAVLKELSSPRMRYSA